MKGILTILGGVGIGAALMFLLDPKGGNRRRALIKDKAISLTTDAQKAFDKKSKDLSNRAKGLMHEAKSKLGTESRNINEQTI